MAAPAVHTTTAHKKHKNCIINQNEDYKKSVKQTKTITIE